MINDVIAEKRIDLPYPIHSFKQRKEITVISMFSNDIKYEIPKPCMIHSDSPPINGKLILSKTYSGRELLSILGGMAKLTKFLNDEFFKTY